MNFPWPGNSLATLWSEFLSPRLNLSVTLNLIEPWTLCSIGCHPVVSINTCSVRGQIIKYVVVSRRSCLRAGTRYNIRGIDAEGQVANYVETEQIVECGNYRCSFVQVGGQYFEMSLCRIIGLYYYYYYYYYYFYFYYWCCWYCYYNINNSYFLAQWVWI